MSEECEKCRGWVCRIKRSLIRVFQAKNEEEVKKLIW